MSENLKPDIYTFDDYRKFLGSMYTYLKETKPFVSYRYLAGKAGFRSPNFLQLVIQSKRNLSAESVDKIIKVLKLNLAESAFFRKLVCFNQATSSDEKKFYADQILRSSNFKKHHPITEAQLSYYSDWYLVAIRELICHPDFDENPEWIAKNLRPQISVSQAQKAFEQLKSLNLVTKNKNGKWIQTSEMLSTGDEVSSSFVVKFHQEMMKLASLSLEKTQSHKREISSVTMGLSQKNFERLKKMIQDFRKQILEISEGNQNVDQVYQVNFQIFPLSEVSE